MRHEAQGCTRPVGAGRARVSCEGVRTNFGGSMVRWIHGPMVGRSNRFDGFMVRCDNGSAVCARKKGKGTRVQGCTRTHLA